jgi:futalosine hydrolase
MSRGLSTRGESVVAGNGSIIDGVGVATVGVGPALAAAATARLLADAEHAGYPYDAVICAGIAGGFAGRVEVGGLAVATVSIAADLGADSPDGFIGLDELGFGTAKRPADLGDRLRKVLPGVVAGPILSVSTVTGTAAGTKAITERYPDAVAEGMEGFGVACAAGDRPFGEVRAISNVVGPRDRSAWRIAPALAALETAFRRLAGVTLER